MTEREALKLALEALANARDYIYLSATQDCTWSEEDQLSELGTTITAIKEALREHAMYEVQRLGQEIQPEPPQRTWVGLTDDEIDQGLLRSDYAFKTAEAWRAGVVFAMTKLKEKNT